MLNSSYLYETIPDNSYITDIVSINYEFSADVSRTACTGYSRVHGRST